MTPLALSLVAVLASFEDGGAQPAGDVERAGVDGGWSAQADAGAAAPLSSPPVVAPPPAVEATAAPPSAPAKRLRLTLLDGQELTGTFVREDAAELVVKIGSSMLAFRRNDLRAIDDIADLKADGVFLDPNRTRYLYSPSAMMLRQGEITLSQVELLLTTVAVGVTDWLSLQAGASIPIWFAQLPQSLHAVAAVKLGWPVHRYVHIAGGVQTLVLPFLNTGTTTFGIAGVGFGTVTVGHSEMHASLSGGALFTVPGSASPAFSLSGSIRLARPVALVTENWIIPDVGAVTSSTFIYIFTAAARLMGEQLAVDLGLALAGAGKNVIPFPIPIVSVAYNFRPPRARQAP